MITPQCAGTFEMAPSAEASFNPTPAIEVPECHADGLVSVSTSQDGVDVGTERKLRILIVEDDPSDVELVCHTLRSGGCHADCDVVQTAGEFAAAIGKETYDLVLSDYHLPAWNGMETVEILRHSGVDIPVVMVSGALGESKAVECIKQGASDYVLKDDLGRLPGAVGRALREKGLREAHRQTQQELARSNRDLEQFAYVASHDLQEPLRMVAAYTQLLAERYQGKLDANADKYIGYAVGGALRMQALVQDLLTFSRVGRTGRNLRPVDMNGVVQLALSNLQAAMRETNAHVDYQQLPQVIVDATQMVQLLQNLIANALKFHGQEVPHIFITAERGEREWIFSVRDNGIGIAPEHIETVFIIFKRLHTHEEYPGSGIGLAICKRIVEQHGGRIWVESRPGQGSTFKFSIPVAAERRTYDHFAGN